MRRAAVYCGRIKDIGCRSHYGKTSTQLGSSTACVYIYKYSHLDYWRHTSAAELNLAVNAIFRNGNLATHAATPRLDRVKAATH